MRVEACFIQLHYLHLLCFTVLDFLASQHSKCILAEWQHQSNLQFDHFSSHNSLSLSLSLSHTHTCSFCVAESCSICMESFPSWSVLWLLHPPAILLDVGSSFLPVLCWICLWRHNLILCRVHNLHLLCFTVLDILTRAAETCPCRMATSVIITMKSTWSLTLGWLLWKLTIVIVYIDTAN